MSREPEDRKSQDTGLRRSLGLPAALAIGVGTMVGAGIFVFPGLVAERIGPPGLFAFLLAGAVALAVAVYTSELATDMPLSGGGYTFTERVFGRLAGATVGFAQCAGLLFASAFYLVSFATYVGALMNELDRDSPSWLPHLGAGMALALTALNVFGSRGAGQLQKTLVVLLTAALTMLFLYGFGQTLAQGPAAAGARLADFRPGADLGVITTAAMIFTAYIGFVQIATVAGEVREPRRNLPRAIIGSVVLVLALYLLVYFVSARVLPTEALARQGETAVVQVAGELAGTLGIAVTLGAGVFATLSSANASVLSASRTLFALSRDGAVPGFFARTHTTTATPVFAVLAVGLPAAALTYAGVAVLAEIASLLHLVVYGLICLAVFRRRRRMQVPAEGFRAPGPPAVALLSGIACFGLIGFLQTRSLLAGGMVLGLSLVLHLAYRHASR